MKSSLMFLFNFLFCLVGFTELSAQKLSAQNYLSIHFLDMGYGDAILVQTPRGKVYLIDSAQRDNERPLLNRLKDLSIKKIDTAILTHPHLNHFEGYIELFGKLPIGEFYYNGDAIQAEEGFEVLQEKWTEHKVVPKVLKKGDVLKVEEDIILEILHPDVLDGPVNKNSLAIHLRYKETSFLLTADMQPEQQKDMLMNYPFVSESDVVLIPHHGGRLHDEFIKMLNGKTMILSTGPNKWGKPYMDKLNEVKGAIYRTDELGTIRVVSDGVDVWVDGGI